MSPHLDRVSNAEFGRRRSILGREMKERALDAVLIFGTFQGWQNVFYFANHWDLVSCFLVIPAASDPVLITGVYPHLSSIRDVSVIRDVRFGGGGVVDLIASILKGRGATAGGLVLITETGALFRRIAGVRQLSDCARRLGAEIGADDPRGGAS